MFLLILKGEEMQKNKYSALEVLEMAKNIEKGGMDFYKSQALKAKTKLKELFLNLAVEEEEHLQTFVNWSKKLKEKRTEDSEYLYEQEVSAYLKALVQVAVFNSDFKVETVEDALQKAIQAEKDSILLYQEMAEHNQGKTKIILDELINEEKEHLTKLLNYKVELN